MEISIEKELIKNIESFVNTESFSASQKEVQKQAFDFLKAHSIPNKKHEDWLYSQLHKELCFRLAFNDLTKSADPKLLTKLKEEEALFDEQWVFINGEFDFNLSKIKNHPMTDLFKVKNLKNFYHALNGVLKPQILKFSFQAESKPKTVKAYVYQSAECFNKNIAHNSLIHVQKNANASLFIENINESNQDLKMTLNQFISIELEENAKLEVVHLHHRNFATSLYSHVETRIQKNANCTYHLYDLGAKASRHHFECHLLDVHSNAKMYGAMILTQEAESDVFTKMHHHAKDTTSDQDFRSILNQASHGAFFGKIEIDKGASKVDSAQLNKNLLLSKKAKIDTRPQLMVSNDDVKCAHGATIGRLSTEEEFYLISRGFSKEKAQKLLAAGFINENLYKIENKTIEKYLIKILGELTL